MTSGNKRTWRSDHGGSLRDENFTHTRISSFFVSADYTAYLIGFDSRNRVSGMSESGMILDKVISVASGVMHVSVCDTDG